MAVDQSPTISFSHELRRKAIHLTALLIPIGLWILPEYAALPILGFLAGSCLIADLLRMSHSMAAHIFLRIFGPLLRDHEKGKRLTGSTYLLIGSFLCAWGFGTEIAILALLYLIFGDAVAALVGRLWGRVRIGKKTLEGSASCLFVCVGIALISRSVPLHAALVGALVATFVEWLPWPMDDNLTIPIIAGLVIKVLTL
ncbi:MAG: hypothetical protein J7M27_03340 [Candidatus Latescibacteria bacterium]|nr:hypothetical protein [Candidatus Latescibacterota bacterium]